MKGVRKGRERESGRKMREREKKREREIDLNTLSPSTTLLYRVPTEPKKCENRTFKEQIEFEQIAKDYDMEFDRWQKTLTTHVKVCELTFVPISWEGI